VIVTHLFKTSVFAITLAAGTATRFGSAKQLAKFDGIALAQRANKLACDCCDSHSVLVTGNDCHDVIAACMPTSGFITINDNNSGIGSSIAAGMRSVQHAADAVVVLLADQPLITSAHIDALIATWSGDEFAIVATAYAGTTGVPALFARGCFESLLELTGDQGARALFSNERFDVQTIAFEDAAIDIDTVDDLTRLENSARS
jgi:molybdenum cofactor cytidylyltransferase